MEIVVYFENEDYVTKQQMYMLMSEWKGRDLGDHIS